MMPLLILRELLMKYEVPYHPKVSIAQLVHDTSSVWPYHNVPGLKTAMCEFEMTAFFGVPCI